MLVVFAAAPYTDPVRGLGLLLVLVAGLAACVDRGLNIESTSSDAALGFLLEVEGDKLVRVHGPRVALTTGASPFSAWTVALASGTQRYLIEFTEADLRRMTPLVDLGRLSETRFTLVADELCAERYDSRYERVETGLDSSVRSFEVLEDGALQPGALPNAILASSRLDFPMSERPCRPPVEVRPFAKEGVAFEDGFVLGGRPLYFGVGSTAEDALSVRDAQFLPDGRVVGSNAFALFILERGDRLQSDEDPHYFANEPRYFRWSAGTDQGSIQSLAVLPAVSTATLARIAAASARIVGIGPKEHSLFETLLVTFAFESEALTVVSSTVVRGEPTRVLLDGEGRAIVGIDNADADGVGQSQITWTQDGTDRGWRSFDGAIRRILLGPDAARPHTVITRDPSRMFVGDVTRGADTWVEIPLPSIYVTEGLVGVASFVDAGQLGHFFGSENEQVILQWPGRTAEPLPTSLDRLTFGTGCHGAADECGSVPLPPEADEVTLLELEGHPRWFLYLPRRCRVPVAIREDGCATHLPLGLTIPALAERSFRSLRYSAASRRGLLAGSEGRLFELMVDP